MLDESIRAVFFDVGGTLIDVDYDLIANLLGGGVSGAQLRQAEPQLRIRMNDFLSHAGRLTETPDTFRFMMASLGDLSGAEISEAALRRIAEQNAKKSVWSVINSDAVGVGETMVAKGYRVGVISNSDGSVAALLDECGFRGQFETVVDSAIVGVAKPDPRIFRIAMNQMGVTPSETAYVGDIPAVDIVGARAAGITPVLYDRCGVYRDLPGQDMVSIITSLTELTSS